ncbi:Type I transmembrane sorting receptor [Podila epigama]|nr:Type I transmembrane sorting receptor [Podila epigama]
MKVNSILALTLTIVAATTMASPIRTKTPTLVSIPLTRRQSQNQNLAAQAQYLKRRYSRRSTPGVGETPVSGGESPYTVEIAVGTPSAKFVLSIDTGSSDISVMSSECPQSTCGNMNRYDASSSSTSTQLSGIYNASFADGYTAEGPLFLETVSIAGITAEKQTIASITTLKGNTPHGDGILGLGLGDLVAAKGATTFMDTVTAQNSEVKNIFAVLAPVGGASGRLTIGGEDPALYDGPLTYTQVSGNTYWNMSIDGVVVNDKLTLSGYHGTFDTGATLVGLSASSAKSFYENIPGVEIYDAAQGYYSAPCDAMPKVAIQIDGTIFAISPVEFNLGETSPGSKKCVCGLSHVPDFPDDEILIGQVFFSGKYVVFDKSGPQPRVGVAMAKTLPQQ